MSIPFPTRWVCSECRGNEWIDGQPCLTCRPHERAQERRCICDGSGIIRDRGLHDDELLEMLCVCHPSDPNQIVSIALLA